MSRTMKAALVRAFGEALAIDGPAFVYSDRESGRVVTILGYPTDKLADTA